jgi:hypothetical protein
MVYIFGMDVPFIELLIVGILAMMIILATFIIMLMWINKKEYGIIKEAENIIDIEHRTHNIPTKTKKK